MKLSGIVDSYVRLVQAGRKTIEEVPEDVREAVEAKLVEKIEESEN